MDPLIELPQKDWCKLRDMFGSEPINAVPFCMLDMLIKHPGLAEEFGLKIYCPEGNISNGMIATSLKCNYYQVIIHPMEGINNTTSKIKEALLTTKVIDWERNVTVPSASDVTIECLNEIKSNLGVNVHYDEVTRAYKHYLSDKPKEWRYDISLPPNTEIGPLKDEHIDLVNKTWTYHDENTYYFFQTLKKYDLIHTLYTKQDGNPLAWVAIDSFGGLSHLFCLEEHRRKGYAEVVAKHAINYLLDNEQKVVAYTLKYNTKAKQFFNKLSFSEIGYNHWVMINKNK